MKRILRSRLPERFADRVPPALVEIGIAVTLAVAMTAVRIALTPVTGDRAPYAFVFVGVVCAAVLAGWRSGLLALALGQLLAWTMIIMPTAIPGDRLLYAGGLAVSSFAELLILAVITLYQREVDKAWSRREAQVDLLHQALAEIDHRTSNNYQTVLSLILSQAQRAEPPVKDALNQVADRIQAIALASKQLAISSESLEQVRVTHHLGELCAQIRQGLSRPGVNVECNIDDLSVGAEQAIAMSILVNELVTNALKHAFPDNREGQIRVSLGRANGHVLLEVADNGVGISHNARTRGTGLGSRLIDTFVKQLQARHEVETGNDGTRHRIQFPLAA